MDSAKPTAGDNNKVHAKLQLQTTEQAAYMQDTVTGDMAMLPLCSID